MENRTNKDSAIFFGCPLCGEFVVTECDCVNLKSDRLRVNWEVYQVSALLREQTVRRLPPFWLRYGMDPYGPLEWDGRLAHIDLTELLQRWPRTVTERVNRTLCNVGYLSEFAGDRVEFNDTDYALAFAQNIGEFLFHKDALIDQNYAQDKSVSMSDPKRLLQLLPLGWARFEELERGRSKPENPAFVAMWFGGDVLSDRQAMEAAFHQGIHPAIERAGYRAVRSDLVEHNEWIMDKIMSDIRLAPFIVADFTAHRGGVYWEAGFGRGLGTTVIHTCRADHMKGAHFDTAQMNHVVWNTPEELKERLYHRIVATIGEGPHQGSSPSSTNRTSSTSGPLA